MSQYDKEMFFEYSKTLNKFVYLVSGLTNQTELDKTKRNKISRENAKINIINEEKG